MWPYEPLQDLSCAVSWPDMLFALMIDHAVFFLSQSKIVRVLNLWQKNGVLPTEVIQPLMDLAKDPQDPLIFQNGKI